MKFSEELEVYEKKLEMMSYKSDETYIKLKQILGDVKRKLDSKLRDISSNKITPAKPDVKEFGLNLNILEKFHLGGNSNLKEQVINECKKATLGDLISLIRFFKSLEIQNKERVEMRLQVDGDHH